MKLSQLARAADLICTQDAEITALTHRAEEVTTGSLFAALEGARADGKQYIPQAVKQGCGAVLCREKADCAVPLLTFGEPRMALARMAAEFYGRPGDRMTLVAVTGTKGKTTTACMLREILMAAGEKVGMMGTLGAFIDRQPIAPPGNTTPEPILLHRLLGQMAEEGCTHVVMEVSSQGVKQYRTYGLTFELGIFLNLSPDHIGPGEHESFEEYRACKAALFRQCVQGVFHESDESWPLMAAELPTSEVHLFGKGDIVPRSDLTLEVEGNYLPMPGAFNGENALAAMRAADLLGVDEQSVAEGLSRVQVPGRCLRCPVNAPFTVLIDYAHNGAAMSALLAALKEHPHNRLVVVFGAGGNRPPMRRQDLGRAAADWADFAVLTEDNPRWESAREICTQIASAMPDLPHVIIPDRTLAIRFALATARPGDIVALLGKGHEEYIERRGVKEPFSELEVVREYFQEKMG